MQSKNKALLAVFPFVGAALSRWHGGGFIGGSPKLLKAFLWSAPFSAVSVIPYFEKDWKTAAFVGLAVLGWSMVFKNTGHGGGMDLAHSPKEPGAGRTPEKLEYLILWLHGRMPQYWYDFLLLTVIGLFSMAAAAIAVGCVNIWAGLLIASGGLGKPIGYAIGWRYSEEIEDIFPKDFDEATEIGETLTGMFAFGALAAAAWMLIA